MKYKYVMIGGLAFSEEEDMKKLGDYARQGWFLDGILGGFFYKLKKGTPEDLIYSLDYQNDAGEEYFSIFKEAGWNKVLSIGKQMHIFSAKRGTKSIYTKSEDELDKYVMIKNTSKRGSIASFIAGIILACICAGFIMTPVLKKFALIPVALTVFDMVVFIFNFLPYLVYSYRVNSINKYGNKENNSKNINKMSSIVFGICALFFLLIDIKKFIVDNYFSVFNFIFCILYIFISYSYYKKYKKLKK